LPVEATPSAGWFAGSDALDLARLVRQGEVSAREVLNEARRAAEVLNPHLNAVVHCNYDQAEATTDTLPQGLLTGVPMLLKDALAQCAGTPLTYGSRLLGDYVCRTDSRFVRNLRAAGAVIVGRTNTPEFAIMGTTEPVRFGPTRNPWDLDRSVGGSSGGAAAAVASGLVPLAHGTDSGGSIRIPAAWCGVFGLKPTGHPKGRRSSPGDAASGMLCEHVLARSVRDSAVVLDVMQGVGEDPSHHSAKAASYVRECELPPGRLRLAWSSTEARGQEVDRACATAVEDLVKLCEELGHEVVEARLPTERCVYEAIDVVGSVEVASDIDWWSRVVGTQASSSLLEPFTWDLYRRGRRRRPDYPHALSVLRSATQLFEQFFQSYDCYLCPVLAAPPLPIGSWNPGAGGIAAIADLERKTSPFTAIFNATGQPAMSVPFGWTEQGLPVGVQVAGRLGAELTLLRLASEIERASPWGPRYPPLHAGRGVPSLRRGGTE
jgi:amidase